MSAARRIVGALLALGVVLAGCSAPEKETPPLVGLLAADAESPRGQVGGEAFAAEVAELCGECDLVRQDAGGDAEAQLDQVRELLADGVDVVVLEAVDPEIGEEIVEVAGDVPVVALDRAVPGARARVGVDRQAAGELVAAAVGELAGRRPRLVQVTGPAGSGAEELTTAVVDSLGRRARVVAQVRRPAGGVVAARESGADVVVTGDDAAAAAVAEGLGPGGPLVTGYGGDLEAVRRLVQGTQSLTVYAPSDEEAALAARAALELIDVQVPTPSDAVEPVEDEGVPTVLLEPTVVTLDTLTNTVVRDGVFTTREICAGRTARRCTALGIR